MRKRILITFCVSLLIMSCICTPAMAARKVLSVPAYEQQKSGWCWAACSKSTIQFIKGSSPTQSAIATYIHGSDNNKGATISQTKSALAHWNVTSSINSDRLSYTAVLSQINYDRPIFAGLQYQSGGKTYGHFNLIRGYDTDYNGVLFIDPLDGAYHGQNYSDYRDGIHYNGVDYEWAESVFDCQ